ncbi:MAG: DUF4230 domain-containing protein, partial [Chloroflexota bacterium]
LLGLVLLLIIGGYQAINSVMGNINSVMGNVNSVSGNIDAFGTQVSEVLNPTPTLLPDPVTIIHEVRSLARLETIQYSVEKVITAEVGQGAFGFLIGDRLLFVAHGEVIAGIDLEKLSPEDLTVVDGVLYVNLPTPEIFIATLDNDLSYIYDRDTGLLTKGNVDLETLARQAAEKEILNAALESGILLQAQTNAENYLWRLFNSLGFPEIIFVQLTPEPSS